MYKQMPHRAFGRRQHSARFITPVGHEYYRRTNAKMSGATLDLFIIENTMDATPTPATTRSEAITTNNRWKKAVASESSGLPKIENQMKTTSSPLHSNSVDKMLTVKSSLFSIEHIIKKE